MCPYYIAIGMTMDEYWNASPYLVRYYREAHKMRIEQRNQELWLQGLYIYNAFGVVLANAFSKKGRTKEKYMEKPIELFPKQKQEGATQAEKDKITNDVVSTLNRIQAAFRNKHGKAGEQNGNRSP
jgi:predicted metal-dependent peptidase